MHRKSSRRDWILSAAAAPLLAGCGRSGAVRRSRVSITRAAAYDQGLYSLVRSIIEQHGLDVRGRNVVLKPNLVEFEPQSCINTSPLLVHAVFEAFLSMGAARVRIAEGPGHRRNTLDLADAAGYFQTIRDFENQFIDLNLDDVSPVRLARPFSRLDKLYLPGTVLGADLLVSMPKMKTHHWVGATLSMKNLFGVVPGAVYGWPKNLLHWAGIDECIADLHAVFPRQFAIVDGIAGMEGNGPIQGVAKHAGVLAAGRDPVAVDATCCRIMHIDPERIGYLRLAANGRTAHSAEADIEQIGEKIRDIATPFALPPNLGGIRLQST